MTPSDWYVLTGQLRMPKPEIIDSPAIDLLGYLPMGEDEDAD